MSADNLEGPEVDLLIRELSSVPKPAARPVVPNRPFASLEALQPIAPVRKRRTFVSAMSLPSLPRMSLPRMSLGRMSLRGMALSGMSVPGIDININGIITPGPVAMVRMWVGLGVLLSSAMPYWPYPKDGAWWLLLYFLAVGMVLVDGIWSAQLTWATRRGLAHTVALGVVLWGITLGAVETLPLIGYVKLEAVQFGP